MKNQMIAINKLKWLRWTRNRECDRWKQKKRSHKSSGFHWNLTFVRLQHGKFKRFQMENMAIRRGKEGLERSLAVYHLTKYKAELMRDTLVFVLMLVCFCVCGKVHPKSNENHQHYCYSLDLKIDASVARRFSLVLEIKLLIKIRK